jgi:hypothetical protein
VVIPRCLVIKLMSTAHRNAVQLLFYVTMHVEQKPFNDDNESSKAVMAISGKCIEKSMADKSKHDE